MPGICDSGLSPVIWGIFSMGKKKERRMDSNSVAVSNAIANDRPKGVTTAYGESIELSDKFTFQTKYGRKCVMYRIDDSSWECRDAADDSGGRVWFAEQIIDRLTTKEWQAYEPV